MENEVIIAVLAALFALGFKRVDDFFIRKEKRRNYRSLLEDNINNTLLPKLKILREDYNKSVRFVIDSRNMEQYDAAMKMGVDEMPMFNNSLFLNLSKEEVYDCLTDKSKFAILTDAYFTIAFLRDNMPYKMINSYNEKVRNHMKTKTFENRAEFFKHYEECNTIDIIRKNMHRGLNSRFQTVDELNEQLNSLKLL